MMRVLALAGRDWRSYFLSPVGYVIVALFVLMSGFVFMFRTFDQGQPASLRSVFEWGTWMLLFVCPAISMRTLSEERRMGTLEMLMTCPVSETEVILGKFLASMGVLVLMFAPLLIHVLVLERFGRPDYGELACGFLGMLLAGGAYLASGILVSSLTSSQVVAFLVTLFFWIVLSVGMKFLPERLHEPWSTFAFAADPDPRLRDFAIGLIDTSNIAYFASLITVFLILAVHSLGVRRWR